MPARLKINTASLLSRMSGNPWFGALPLADREALLRYAELLYLRPGEMLFRQGDAPSGFYGVLSGTLKISSLREDGREAILVWLEAGNWMGEISQIDRLPRTHDATALVAASVLVVPQPVFAAQRRSVTTGDWVSAEPPFASYA